ncbi:MAG TPA: isochorismatase family protein [Defluviitoga sp.]|nr:isochorismatase family protein [Defluviitoga sp.]HOP24094.1 isochorismatase family protein [Defluviitoga sp.]HPZ28572.1 isochorismatase family protein [Defluviitoga sp.]HQD62390.1 isochorismatase family protein [Defluviitoga sp.]
MSNKKNPTEIINIIVSYNLSPLDSAIICIDCQNGFTERCPNELPVEGTSEIWINEINEFLKIAKSTGFKIFASIDDHPENHISFKIWPPHCIQGSYGNELFISTYDTIIRKGFNPDADSYSAFYSDVDKNIESELNLLLKKENIENLIILGLAGDVCVISTIQDALKREYKVYPIERYIKSVNKKSMREIIAEKFGKII